MTDHKIVYRDPAKLKGYAKNSRQHPADQVAQIRRSIDEFTFTNPVLLREDGVSIGAGHGRVAAALLDPPLERVPTIIIPGLTDDQWRAYVLADNRIPLGATWSDELLRAELSELSAAGFDLNLTGFGELELKSLFAAGPGKTDPEDAPEPPKAPVTQAGDLWLLGDHRLICGSSTDAATVERVLAGAVPHLMVTDPPYGVNYDPNWRNEPEKLNLKSKTAFKTKKAATGVVMNDDREDWREAWNLFPGNVAYVWHGERQSPSIVAQFKTCGFEPRNLIVWAKNSLVISRGHYHPQHETCWYLVRKGATAAWAGDRKQSTLWQINKNRANETGHSTQKPIEAMRRPIENNSKVGDAIYDPFVGSGTTLIAAQMTARCCLAVELDPGYCDVVVQRWQDFAGLEARLEETGETFVEVKTRRSAPQRAPRKKRAAKPEPAA